MRWTRNAPPATKTSACAAARIRGRRSRASNASQRRAAVAGPIMKTIGMKSLAKPPTLANGSRPAGIAAASIPAQRSPELESRRVAASASSRSGSAATKGECSKSRRTPWKKRSRSTGCSWRKATVCSQYQPLLVKSSATSTSPQEAVAERARRRPERRCRAKTKSVTHTGKNTAGCRV